MASLQAYYPQLPLARTSGSPPYLVKKNHEPAVVSDEKDNKNKGNNNLATVDSHAEGTGEEVIEGVKRGLSNRHAQMIALGGAIGTGLFVSSGATLAQGGPAFILGSFIFVSILMYFIVTALVEIAVAVPIHGPSMSQYGGRMVSKSLEFALGWLYFYSLGILVPYEITAGALVIYYWNSPVNVGVWITILLLLIVFLNFLPVRWYGEAEFWFASVKVIAILGLLILSFVLFWGGGPRQHGILGFHYWNDPGATTTWILEGSVGKFTAFVGTLISSIFPFTFAPELLIFTSGEMKNPEVNLPLAARRYIWRLLIFYVCSILAITVICPYDAPGLVSGSAGAKASPFVIGIKEAGIRGLSSVVNAAILTSAWSAGNAYLYMSSRALYAMALSRNAPRVFRKTNKHGVPYMAVAGACIFIPLAYLNVGSNSSVVFRWFVNLTTTSGFVSWIVCCIIFIRFRKAFKAQGGDHRPYHSRVQPLGAWIALIVFTVLCIFNGFNVFLKGQFTAAGFLTAYVGLPAFFVLYIGHKIIAGRSDPWVKSSLAANLMPDLISPAQEEDEEASGSRWKRWGAHFT